MKTRIVQVAAHMGAGAGKAISGLATNDLSYEHEIILLQMPEKLDHVTKCREKGISVCICPDDDIFDQKIADADVVLINWWHHPTVFSALLRIEKKRTRTIIWNHINGLVYPRLSSEFLKCFDACMFSTNASLNNAGWTEDDRKRILEKSSVIYGMGDFRPEKFTPKEDYSIAREVRVGYVGSLDYAKMHPDFIRWIREALKLDDDIYFYLAGDLLPDIDKDVRNNNLIDRVSFLGFRNDVPQLLRSFDVFVYPLNPQNFATTENAILEAMAVGLPIVSSKGVIEESIIKSGENGFLVSDSEEFAQVLTNLLHSKEQRRRLGQKAREDVINTYSIEENIYRFHRLIEAVMLGNKHEHAFSKVVGMKPHKWFFSGCDKREREIIEHVVKVSENENSDGSLKEFRDIGRIFWGKSKGSVEQFHSAYSSDEVLRKLVEKMKKERNKYEGENRDALS